MLQFLVSCLLMVCSEPAGEESPRDWWIGYCESLNVLPVGQFANWITRGVFVVRTVGSQRRSIGAELASQEHSWTQFAGWSPDGRHAIVYSSWEDPANAQWEREHKTFRMTEGWLVDSCLVDINNGSIQNLTSSKRVSIYNTGLFFLPDGKGYGFTALLDGISKPFQMDFDGGNKRDVSGGGTGFSYGYSASPDGSRISYHEDYQVFIANSDGSNKRRIETGPYSATTLYSDDDGITWQVSPSRIALPKRGAMEPHVEETGDGRVLMVMRNQLGKLYFSESTDEGATWSEPWASELITPESCPELTRIPGTGDLLLIWNNHYDASFRSHFGKRSPLTSAISKDHGKSWQSLRDIETDPSRAFSNPGCRFTRDGKAIVNYWTCEYLPDWRMQDVIDLRVAVIDTAWFYGGKSSR